MEKGEIIRYGIDGSKGGNILEYEPIEGLNEHKMHALAYSRMIFICNSHYSERNKRRF